MKLRFILPVLLLPAVILAVLNVLISSQLIQQLNKVEEVQESRAECLHLAGLLRRTSDDLTRFSRMYVVTGNPDYKDYFNNVVAIRNGTLPRPLGYDRIYWDLVLAGRRSSPKEGEITVPISINKLLRRTSITEKEFELLERAKKHSDKLVELEKRAFDLVDGRAVDPATGEVSEVQPNRTRALELLHDKAYLQAKADIMEPFNTFENSVDKRTRKEIDSLKAGINQLAFWELGTTSGLVVVLILTSAFILWRVLTRIRTIENTCKQVELGDLQVQSGVRGKDELGRFGLALDNMIVTLSQNLLSLRSEKITIEHQNQKLSELNALKNRYVGMAAHDLKNPLVSIRGFSEFLLENEERDPDEEELVQMIHRLSSEMLELVDELLDISVLESGNVALHPNHISIRKLLDERLVALKPTAHKKLMQLVTNFSDAGDCIADEERITQVIDNLITNAIKYSPPGSTISVTEGSTEKEVIFTVEDEGPGFTDDDKKKVFKDFQRLSARPTGDEGSTGLGLSIVKRIIDAHNGKIFLESTHGEGAKFTVCIPKA